MEKHKSGRRWGLGGELLLPRVSLQGAVHQEPLLPPQRPPPPSSQQDGCKQLSLCTSLQNIFAWCGGKSNILERNKARDLALAIRDSERQGKAQVEIVTDGEEPAEMIQVGGH